jgi:hypothetical protein
MTVSGQHQVHVGSLEALHQVLLEAAGAPLGILFVGAPGDRRVMQVDDHPVGVRRIERLPEPAHHRRVLAEATSRRIHRHQAHVATIDGVVGLVARGRPTRLSPGRIAPDVVEGTGLGARVGEVRPVVAQHRPHRPATQKLRVHLEDSDLVIAVGPGRVGIVAQQDPHVGRSFSGEVQEPVAHGTGVVVAGPGVAQRPDPQRSAASRRGRRGEDVLAVAAGQPQARGAYDRVGVTRVRLQVADDHLVLAGRARVAHLAVQTFRCGPDKQATRRRAIGAPANRNTVGRRALEPRPAQDAQRMLGRQRRQLQVEAQVGSFAPGLVDLGGDHVAAGPQRLGRYPELQHAPLPLRGQGRGRGKLRRQRDSAHVAAKEFAAVQEDHRTVVVDHPDAQAFDPRGVVHVEAMARQRHPIVVTGRQVVAQERALVPLAEAEGRRPLEPGAIVERETRPHRGLLQGGVGDAPARAERHQDVSVALARAGSQGGNGESEQTAPQQRGVQLRPSQASASASPSTPTRTVPPLCSDPNKT